ncbi:hypothetical protein PEX2_100690 [Penicillium expansum]|uniref:Uncharacterized protein n=1 Tax=Penicillium expansum TaxID=27334 RepID=A0A0A2JZF2_PENEN|nr:hypothetical protein PEX2_100690 [Penicillium expansum]KGO60804.1 hypothetical protein PEX2_100690 [Penicillium expansum]
MQGGYNIVCIPREEVTFECRLLNIITIDRTKKSDMGERFFFQSGGVPREPITLYSV